MGERAIRNAVAHPGRKPRQRVGRKPEALLHDAPGRGRRPLLSADTMRERLQAANLVRTDGLPISIRRAAKFLGVSASAVWRALGRQRQRS